MSTALAVFRGAIQATKAAGSLATGGAKAAGSAASGGGRGGLLKLLLLLPLILVGVVLFLPLAAVFFVLRFVFRLVFVRWLKWVKPPASMDSWKETCRRAHAAVDETLAAERRAASNQKTGTNDVPAPESRRTWALRTLGIEGAGMDTPENIRGMYRALVKNHHPDAKGRGRSNTSSFEEIHAAYKFLTDEGRTAS